ncbi:MAG: hypothetical protein JWP10_1425 [Nocardioidaceae bacterium]|nr:hypothetical protein [Nocardioidaceae bacterium]
MRSFSCRVCHASLYFENSVCVRCGAKLAYSRSEKAIVPLNPVGTYYDNDGREWYVCQNLVTAGCTWLAEVRGGLCFSCALTRIRPSDHDAVGMRGYRIAEEAKRHLIVELDTLNFPIVTREEDPEFGLTFDLLSSVDEEVVIGHEDGVITIDLAEGDDSYREKVRSKLDEPYRTMLGHFRHEIGHYYEGLLVQGDLLTRARELFGDDEADYQEAIDRHYAEGPPDGWESKFISTYATMHPYEDFAETFAHYLHICETIENAREFGLVTVAPATSFVRFRDVVVGVWIPLAIALNQINRGMGKEPLYPFVIPDPVIEKLEFMAMIRVVRVENPLSDPSRTMAVRRV